uniref:glycogenin glucosyltransferase n=1 Tax=Clastoptera arizonana TaxID=38151 RepID=A0A1B6DQD4_9HEMI
MSGFAWVTLATNDSYSLGALVLAHSLKRVNTAHQLAILITPGVSQAMRTQLSAVYNLIEVVDVLDSKDEANLTLLARPELGITFTKLHCWRLTQFNKCVFLDADTLVLQNCDELFDREEFSAAPDAGWPDCFNSGVFVYRPSNDTFKQLMDFAVVHGSFDGGDQGLLNLFYKDWSVKDISKHLPFIYNMCSTATYSYLPAFKQYSQDLKIIHFIGSSKPWLQVFDTETGLVRVSGESHSIGSFVQLWWDLFCTYVHTSLSTEMGGLAGALATVTLGSPLSPEQTAFQEHLRRQCWEQGNIDYMGRDSFDNIWRKISETLNLGESPIEAANEIPPPETIPTELLHPQNDIEVTPTEIPLSQDVAETIPLSPASIEEDTLKSLSIPLEPPVVDSPKPTPIPEIPFTPPTAEVNPQAPPTPPYDTEPPSVQPPFLSKSGVTPLKHEQPSTPTITSPTPPTSPPVDPFDTPHPTKLKVEVETPGTPPTGSQPSSPSDEPPIPPKRKGNKSTQDQQKTQTQPKGGKPAKGKK